MEQITYDSPRLCAMPQYDGGYFQRINIIILLSSVLLSSVLSIVYCHIMHIKPENFFLSLTF